MEDDTDIYGDLPIVDIKLEGNFVANQTESNTREYAELKKEIAELTTKLEDCRKVNENLEVNLASLLKTAKAEISRKDRMIDDLRKQLDDVMFKRGVHFKTNDRVRKPTFVDNITIHRQITDSISLPLSQNKHESAETDSSYTLTKNSNLLSKSTLAPLTVFGERLLKRIAEEQSMEKRAKQPSRFGSNNSCVTTIEGYVVESDKENGSVTDVKPSRTKDMQLSAVKEYSEKERFTATDCLPEGRNGMDSNDIGDIADEGDNDRTDRTMNIKCIKSEVKERAPRSTNRESCEDVNSVYDKKHEHTRTKRFECSEKYDNPRFITYSNTERDRYSSIEQRGKKRSHRLSTVADHSSENDADGRIAKRHCRSAERFSISPDDYRSNSVECRRIKQREDRRTTETWGDRRLRGRQPSCESSRDEKYTRSKSNKYDSYDSYRGRSVRRYDNNSDSTDGSKATAKRESRDSRNIEKSEKSARSINKRSDRSEDYECQPKERLKNISRRRIDKSDGEKLMSRTRYCETLKYEKDIDTNKCFEKCDRRRFAGNHEISTTMTKVDDVSRKYQINRNKDSKTMDANEITLDPSICPSNGQRRERSQDRSINGDKPEPSVVPVDVTNTSIVTSTATTDAVATCFATVVSLADQCRENIRNVEHNETVENVENIEKFIRNYNTTEGNHPKNSLDKRNDTSKIAKEHGSPTNHVFKGQTNCDDQRDTIRSDDLKSAETNAKLEEVVSKDALRQVSQGSARNDTKENETTTVPSLVECEKSNEVLETNYLIDLAGDKASINSRTKEVLSNTNTICNIPLSSTSEISKPGCNGNGNVDDDGEDKNKDNNKDDDKTRRTIVSRDAKVDKPNSNCDYSVPDIANGNDDNHDRNHESHDNIEVHKKTNETDHKTVRDEEGTSKEEGIPNLAEKLDAKIEIEEGKINKEKKENSKAVTKQGSRETEKSLINCDGTTNRRNSSTNVHGKIIVFARRKKPVCLANNNANMTVLINNSRSLNNTWSGTSCTMKDNSLVTIRDKRTAT